MFKRKRIFIHPLRIFVSVSCFLKLEMSIVMKFKLLTCRDKLHFDPTAKVTCEIGSAHDKEANII